MSEVRTGGVDGVRVVGGRRRGESGGGSRERHDGMLKRTEEGSGLAATVRPSDEGAGAAGTVGHGGRCAGAQRGHWGPGPGEHGG